jgi:glycosyltransferase involved in cell wall biosynthesis
MVVAPVEHATVVNRTLVTLGSALAMGLAAHTIWNLRQLRTPDPGSPPVKESVSVLIPARNEAAHVGTTVRSLLEQDGIENLHITVLDDASSDNTAEVLAEIDDDRLTVISAPDEPLPAGWLGKPWACSRVREHAHGSVLVFADADVLFQPWALRAAIGELRSSGVSLIAPYPQQIAETWLERLVQPLVTWSWVATMPLTWAEKSLRPSLSAANGQFLVFDAATYDHIGGHRAVAGEVIEDVALMRALKRAGFHTATVDGSHLATCRMYEGTHEVIDGYTKSLWNAFNGPLGSLGVNALLFLSGIVPYTALIFARDRRTKAIGAAGYVATVVSRSAVAMRTGERVIPDVLAHPTSIAAFHVLNVWSWIRHVRGTNTWKGRSVQVGNS